MSIVWNPWHGCTKYSEGCEHCYVYRIDSMHEREAREVKKNAAFELPIKRGRDGFKIKSGEEVYTCLSSDFFLEDADEWRDEAWAMMAARPDLNFIIITKRITRAQECLPPDFGDGEKYSHVTVGCTCENQQRADERLPAFLALPIKHRFIVCEPLLEEIDLSAYLGEGIDSVSVGGESGDGARVCDYAWVLRIRDDCVRAGVKFHFHQTGANFRRDGWVYRIDRKFQHSQARRAGIDIE